MTSIHHCWVNLLRCWLLITNKTIVINQTTWWAYTKGSYGSGSILRQGIQDGNRLGRLVVTEIRPIILMFVILIDGRSKWEAFSVVIRWWWREIRDVQILHSWLRVCDSWLDFRKQNWIISEFWTSLHQICSKYLGHYWKRCKWELNPTLIFELAFIGNWYVETRLWNYCKWLKWIMDSGLYSDIGKFGL